MPPKPQQLSEEEKARKAAEKAKRKAEFEAKRAAELKEKSAAGSDSQPKSGDETKSKADLRKERREQQEAQRAAKAAVKDTGEQSKTATKPAPKGDDKKNNLPSQSVTVVSARPTERESKSPVKPSSLPGKADDIAQQVFPEIPKRAKDIHDAFRGEALHSSVIRLGCKLNGGVIRGSTPRSLAIMVALKQMISDYKTPPGKAIDRDLPDRIDESMKFLSRCKPLTTAMINNSLVVRGAVLKLSQSGKGEDEVIKELLKMIDDYIVDEISCAIKSIVEEASNLILEGETILTYGCSLKIKHVFLQAIKKGKKFSVIVVDSGPRYEGVEMLEFLREVATEDQVRIQYIYISAIAHLIKTVTKVMLGGHGVLASGYVIAEMGSSQIALVANASNVPVVVLCETNEFADSVHTDAFVYNESGLCDDYFTERNERLRAFLKDTEELSEKELKKRKNLKILNLAYDVTPPDYVSMIVTEKGILPCSAVSAVIRRNYTRLGQ